MIRRCAAMLVGLASLLAPAAMGQVNYAQKAIDIRAGVLLLDSQQVAGTQANYDPYVWHNLDRNKAVKPSGWNFTNPLAPGSVTAAIASRWSLLDTFYGGSAFGPAIGERITKSNGAYWELRLATATNEQLSQFDVLLVSVQGFVNINPDERGRLRKFVESGGVLWIDIAYSGAPQLDLVNGFPLPFTVASTSVGAGLDADWLHPLMTYPSTITPNNLLAMQSQSTLGVRAVDLAAVAHADIQEIQQPTDTAAGEYGRFYPVAADQLGPFLSVGRIGDGFMVVTTRGLADTLNRTRRLVNGQDVGNAYEPNRISTAEPYVPDARADAAAKLIVNMVSLTSGHPQFGGGTRKTNGSAIDVGAPLLSRFSAVYPSQFDPGDAYVPPAIFKGLVAITVGNHIEVYDVNPERDLDYDGNPDDGILDYAFGKSYDLVWRSASLSTPISPPTCAEVPNSSVPNQIAVVDGSGNLVVFNAYATPSAAVSPVWTTPVPTGYSSPSGPGRGPYAPTYSEGLYFVADDATAGFASAVGRVWVADASNGDILETAGTPWAVGGNGVNQIRQPSSSPTVGDVPIQDGSGGTDRVVYIPTRASTSGGPQSTPGITSIWFGARGEKPTTWSQAGDQLTVITRASLQGLRIHKTTAGPDPLGIKLSVIDANGAAWNVAQLDTYFKTGVSESNGVLTFTMESGQTLPASVSLRLDYTIDWGTGQNNIQNQIVRGSLYLPGDGTSERMVLQHLAMSPTGTLYLTTAPPNDGFDPLLGPDGGTYFAFKETGRGNFVMLDRYDLYPAHTISPNQSTPVNIAETLLDTDEVQTFAPPFLGGAFTRLRFRSAPVVVGNNVYVTAWGLKANLVDCMVVMCFQADPPAPELIVPEIAGSFTVVQQDMARSPDRYKPKVFSVLQPGQYSYEANQANGKGRIRLTNLSPNQRGLIQNSMSRSLPVLIRRGGQPDLYVEPDRTASKWNTLQWYSVFYGYNGRAPVTVTGNTLFFSGTSLLPDILAGKPFASWQPSGLLVGMDSVISPSDSFLHTNPIRPWLKQLWLVDVDNPGPGSIAPNPDIRWPQSRGVTKFEEWYQRLLQTKLPGSTTNYGVVAGDGVLASWSKTGLFGFARSDFMVADENRLARFDASGNPIWSSDSSSSTGTISDSGSAGSHKPLVRPTRAYSLNSREMMVVDTGGDKVVQMDLNGREIRSIYGFQLDPDVPAASHTGFRPEGYVANESLLLHLPRDVVAYTTYVANPTQFSNPQPLEYWVHFLIADGGNRRLIEIVDRYAADPITKRVGNIVTDGAGNPAVGVLNWHSPANFSNKNFEYTGVSTLYYSAGPGTPSRHYAASIGGSLPSRTALGLDSPSTISTSNSREGGGIVVFNDSAGIEAVVDQVYVPDVPANVYWNSGAGSWSGAAVPGHYKKLNSVRSVSMRLITDGGVRVAIMFTDNDGVYEVVEGPLGWTVRWMLPKSAYVVMRRGIGTGLPLASNAPGFMPTYARRLDSGTVLVVNGFSSKTVTGADFFGEVLEVDGSVDATNDNTISGFSFSKINLGFNWFSVLFQLPPVTGARGIVVPVFADRR